VTAAIITIANIVIFTGANRRSAPLSPWFGPALTRGPRSWPLSTTVQPDDKASALALSSVHGLTSFQSRSAPLLL